METDVAFTPIAKRALWVEGVVYLRDVYIRDVFEQQNKKIISNCPYLRWGMIISKLNVLKNSLTGPGYEPTPNKLIRLLGTALNNWPRALLNIM